MSTEQDFSRLGALLGSYRYIGERAASADAWLAAVTMTGAALEGALLALTILHEEAVRIGGFWPAKRERKGPEFLSLSELMDIASSMGWLVPQEDLAPGIAFLRRHRSLLHPGRVIRDGLEHGISLDRDAYENARRVLDVVVERLAAEVRARTAG